MSAEIIRDRLKNKQERVNFMNAMSDVSWQIEEFFAVYTAKKQTKLNSLSWQNRYVRKSLKMLLNIQPLIESAKVTVLNNQKVINMIQEISNYSLSDEANIFEVTNLLVKHFILFPYIYVDLAEISELLKHPNETVSIEELKAKVLAKHLPKILNYGPNVYKTWQFVKSNTKVLNEFEKECDKSMEQFILNFLSPEELRKFKLH
ncbi:hypothetical protein [Ureaplasma ceti]|uniref:Uncharacterized protein n=1 Tax=Ureaplasma ceti TaxID=3119530 RepID=A0ABP9U659_9BACT